MKRTGKLISPPAARKERMSKPHKNKSSKKLSFYNGVAKNLKEKKGWAQSRPWKCYVTIKTAVSKQIFQSYHGTEIEAAKAADRIYAQYGMYDKFNFLKPKPC